MKRCETATALLFLAGLTGGALLLATSFLGGEGHLEGELRALAADPSALPQFLTTCESAANQDLDRSHVFIQLYGGVQRLTGRQVVVDMANPEYTVARLTDGTLAFQNLTCAPVEQQENARAVADLRDAMAQRYGVPLLYVQAPQKIEAGTLPVGMENYGNENADALLAKLGELGVDTLDLRPALAEAGRDPATPPLFFRTDHHWTPEAAFLAYGVLAEELTQRYGYPADPRFCDPDQYTKTYYDDWFLGSQGKRVGSLYAGTDGITLFTPKFETNFTYLAPQENVDRTGPFEESLLFPERLEPKDYFGGNPYTLYSGGDYSLARIHNNLNPDGPRILLIRDSFSCALAPFLALECGELMTMDMRYFHDDLNSYLDWLQPDLVVVLYSASSAKSGVAFPFTEMLHQKK